MKGVQENKLPDAEAYECYNEEHLNQPLLLW